MQQNFEHAEFVIGDAETALRMPQLHARRPFAEETVSFLNALSGMLRTVREYPDAATFGFWCRRAALMQQLPAYPDAAERLGRGVVFHSTPSNVPVNFAFSFAAGLLAGNANIVRLPGKPFPQVDLICDAVRTLLSGEYADMQPYICFVKYAPDKALSDAFSALCDVRVIWGGDRTVAELRQSPLPARANEITFADRHSAAVIRSEAYLAAENKSAVISGFYNDTYYSDQNACTSPRIIFWLGAQTDAARADFWQRVSEDVKQRYVMQPVQAVGKLHAMYRAAAAEEGLRAVPAETMRLTRLVPAAVTDTLMQYKYNSGYFYEYAIQSLDEILPVCDRRCQTLTYFGLTREELRAFLTAAAPNGIDRAVPVGKSMDFSLIWDGHDLIREMSRRLEIV